MFLTSDRLGICEFIILPNQQKREKKITNEFAGAGGFNQHQCTCLVVRHWFAREGRLRILLSEKFHIQKLFIGWMKKKSYENDKSLCYMPFVRLVTCEAGGVVERGLGWESGYLSSSPSLWSSHWLLRVSISSSEGGRPDVFWSLLHLNVSVIWMNRAATHLD